MGDNLKNSDRSWHQGVWETGMQLASERKLHVHAAQQRVGYFNGEYFILYPNS